MTNKFTALILLALFFSACEDDIYIDLDKKNPALVVEGKVTNLNEPIRVLISESQDFYEPNTAPGYSGAEVTISDTKGNTYMLKESFTKGEYITEQAIQGVPGVTYTLKVKAKGAVYTAHSTMPKPVAIDTLIFEYEEENIIRDEGYYVTCNFQDPAATADYYRLKILVNGSPYIFDTDGRQVRDHNFYLTRDKYYNGNVRKFEFSPSLKMSDHVYVELHHIEEATYRYYDGILDIINGDANSNPVNNIEGDGNVVGYFAALSIARSSTNIN